MTSICMNPTSGISCDVVRDRFKICSSASLLCVSLPQLSCLCGKGTFMLESSSHKQLELIPLLPKHIRPCRK